MVKKKGFLQRFRRKTEQENRIVPRHKIKIDKDKKK